jgi:hypothetical protein
MVTKRRSFRSEQDFFTLSYTTAFFFHANFFFLPHRLKNNADYLTCVGQPQIDGQD